MYERRGAEIDLIDVDNESFEKNLLFIDRIRRDIYKVG